MKIKALFIALSLSTLFVTPSVASPKDDYRKAWDAFFQNKRTEARQLFTQSLADNEIKPDAHLGLCLLNWSESRMEDAFAQFSQFYHASPQPDAYLYSLYSMPFTFADGDVLQPERLAFLEEISSRPMNGTLKTMILETLGKHYWTCKEFDKANQLYARTGALRNWQVLGTFNNISGSGFDKDWGAVGKSREKDTFTNLAGASVGWYSPGLNKADGWFDFTFHFPLGGVIAYAQTFVTSPQAQEVYLRTGTSGSLKIWVNDAQVLAVRDERNCDLDLYACKISLNKGANRLLLQLGQSEVNALNFLARITDANGNPIEDLTHRAEPEKYNKASASPAATLLPFFAEEYLLNKIKADNTNPVNHLALAETYLRNDKADEGIVLLKQLQQQQAPHSSYVHHRLSEAYIRAQNQTYYTREIENLKKDDPDSFQALDNLSGEAISSNKISEVKNICQKMKNLYGESTTTRYLDSWLANKQNRQEEYIAISRANYERYPSRYGYVNTMFNIEENMLKNSKAATALIEDYCAKYFSPAALDLLSGRYIKDGDTEKGLKILHEKIELLPYAVGYIQNLANTLYKMQRYDEALAMTDRMLRLNPALDYIYSLRADIYTAMNEDKKAAENYRKAILYNPTQFEARTQLRQLEGKKEVEDLFPRYKLDSLIAAAPSAGDYPDDNSVILLYDTKLMFHPEGATEYHVEMAVKILNQTGVEMWKEYSIPYYRNQQLTLDKSEIIKENGQKVKAETNGGHLVFTNLEPGNTLYMEYRIKDYSSDLFSHHFYDQYIFQFAVPTMVTAYSILAPKDKKFSYEVANGTIEPVVSTVEGMKLYHWALTNQPAIRIEPLMSGFVDVVPTLSFSSIPNWEFIENWYKDLTADKFKDDYLLSETMDEILRGNEGADQLTKAKLFYEYIQSNITYSNVPFMQNNFIPQKASRTISTRLGDCKDVSTLFVALCRKAGIDANLVLILTRNNGRNILPLPANNFNHCIARLRVDGKTYYLELTDNRLPFAAASEVDLYSPILPIPYGNEKLGNELLSMEMPFRQPNATSRRSHIQFTDNGFLTTMRTVRSGSSASGFRHSYVNIGSEEQLKQMTQAAGSDYATPIKVSDLSFEQLDSRADTVVYTYTIEAGNMVQNVAGMQIFKIKWTDNMRTLEELSLETRKYPFELWMYMMEDACSEQITLVLPEGKTLVEMPKDIHLECANMLYDLRFEMKQANELVGTRTMKRKTQIVSPEEYAEFRKFMQEVSEGDNRQYVIK